MSRGENALVEWLRTRFAADANRVPIGIGDDAAIVRFDGHAIMITADMLLDGIHFDTREHTYEVIGHKAIACSLSDCAAMACEPRAATVSVALSASMSLEDVQCLYEGIARVADRFGCAVVGGDTTSWPGLLAIDVAMLAEPMAPRGAVLRSNAKSGDVIYVSGPLGGSITGKHLSFEPRLELARQLAGRPDLHAMMDISDGLALDLHRLCTASHCDAELDAEQIETVISEAAHELARTDGRPAIDHALTDGEDFELLITGGPDLETAGLGLTPVGRIVQRAGNDAMITLRLTSGRREPVEPRGYEHFK